MFFAELVTRTARSLAAQGPLWAVVLAIAAFTVTPWARRWASRAPVAHLALAAVLALGAAWAWSLVWASDDAYISFRYARHLVRGDGLVFNRGERVEGYTDFLWTVLVSGLLAVGLPAGESAIVVSLLSFLVLLVLVARLAERVSPPGSRTLPIAALLTAASYTVASFATSGLETVLAALFVVAALTAAEVRRPTWAGLLGVLAILCHPDHLLFYVGLGGAVLLTSGRGRPALLAALRYAAPFVLVFLPYFAWRWHYYGDAMPNTYYAKSGSLAYFTQGGIYLAVTVVSASLWAIAPLVVIGTWQLRRTVTGWFALLAVPLYLVYVAKIGGDFMLGRLWVPVLPVLFVLVEVGVRSRLLSASGRGARALTVALTCLAAMAALPVQTIGPVEIFHGIADERTFTSLWRFSPLETGAAGYAVGKTLHGTFKERGLTPKVAIFSIGMAGYYSDLPISDLRGLTSRSVAHMPLLTRGRPGHEKVASPGLVLESGASLSELGVYPPPYDDLGQTIFGGFHFNVVRFDPQVATVLVNEGGARDFRQYLDDRLPSWAALRGQDPARFACDLWHARAYYFEVNDDAPRRAALGRALAAQDAGEAALWEGFLRPGDEPPWERVADLAADTSAWRTEGDASAWRVWQAPANQAPPSSRARRAPFVDTYTLASADASTGTLTSPPFTVVGDAITAEVAGGLQPTQARLELVVDGQVVASATGCGAELFGLHLWDVRGYRGHRAELRVVDATVDGWGHLEVDRVTAWRVPGLPAT